MSIFGQNLPIIHPKILNSNYFTKSQQAIWQKALDNNQKINSGTISYENLSLKDQNILDSLESGYGPETQGVDCSWYCGGGPYKISDSTDKIHDFNLFTSWMSGKTNEVIGKKIVFHFKAFSPRINEILIWNGYIKNTKLWKSYSRVAKFKLYINNIETSILKLEDVNNTQSFKINPIQSTDPSKDLILTLEIIEIYKGSKYKELAISEINFNGLDVHCFASGTNIAMADNSLKAIEKIENNDTVLTIDFATNKIVKTQVIELIKVYHTNLFKLKFSDREIITTDDHPFLREDNNWVSINPSKSNLNYIQEKQLEQLNIGDKFMILKENKIINLIAIQKIYDEQLTYTLLLSKSDNFFANGLLVKTEIGK